MQRTTERVLNFKRLLLHVLLLSVCVVNSFPTNVVDNSFPTNVVDNSFPTNVIDNSFPTNLENSFPTNLEDIFLTNVVKRDASERDEPETENCETRRMTTEVTYPGCDPLLTAVNYCTGSCYSYVIQSNEEPYLDEEFRCCAATVISVKRRKLLFNNCVDEDGVVNPNGTVKTIFFPYFNECKCVEPFRLLNGQY